MNRFVLQLRLFDWTLFFSALLLVVFGLVILFSLTLNVENPDLSTFRQQAVFAAIGCVLLFVFSTVDYRYLRSYGWPLFALGVVLLLAVLLFGQEIRGARSWFAIGTLTFQPVEAAKLCLIIFFAKYFSDHASDLTQLRHLIVSGAGAGLYLVLVMVQPDLGSAMILLGLFLAMALFVNVRRTHLGILLIVFVVGAVLSWLFLLRPYQKERIRTVFQPSRDPLGIGYNVKQATVAIGSGRLFGRGLGLGTQSQLKFLPEQKTDFIFAVIAEELGFVGAGVLVLLFLFLFYRCYRIAQSCRDAFGVYLIFGIFVVFFLHTVMNIGMNIGLMPVVGVPLPFLSAGGSSLITTLLAVGIVESVAIRQKRLSASAV